MSSSNARHPASAVAAAVLALVSAGPGPAADGPRRYLGRPDDWFRGGEAARVAANVLSHQAADGGWPKNVDTTAALYAGDRAKLRGTFDNGATTGELRLLARVHRAAGDERSGRGFLKGLDHVLAAQYPSGGWPQFAPPPANTYHRHVTFNDDTMVRLLEFLREVAAEDRYGFAGGDRRRAAKAAFDRGVECVLRCQVRVNGRPTGWCAQHDEADLRPRPGRAFEPAALSGAESVGIVRLLMSLERPSPDVVRAVDGAVGWLRAVRLTGVRVVRAPDAKSPTGRNKVVTSDPAAPPLWARFYEIGTDRPVFADRDGVTRYSLADIGYERRNGYAWYGDWPQPLLQEDYPTWQARRAGKAR